MYALVLKLNGSLTHWEASHDSVVFAPWGDSHFRLVKSSTVRTLGPGTIAFTYFPLFWYKRNFHLNLVDVVSQSINA